jgi:hypothetical protein
MQICIQRTKFKNTKLAHVELNTKCAVVLTGNFNGCGHQHLHPTQQTYLQYFPLLIKVCLKA